ncbi:Uncharacterised protein [uncultured archaeon]|nr:Uncharacterised protein [uncultured archaeon]
MSDNGFIAPRKETIDGETILRPGFAGNILLGSAAAFISWGLYGAFSSAVIYGGVAGVGAPGADDVYVSISAVAGAVLVGIGGARWLTNEVDKKLLRSAAVTAASSKASSQDARRLAVATPAKAFNIAKKMYQE